MSKPEILRIAYPPEVCRLVPETESSHILGGSRYMIEPIDLDKYDYVEEEYIVGGKANVYHWSDNERYPHILLREAPYCSRMIVRKPRDPQKFSGLIHCELMNSNSGLDRSNAGWAPCHEHLMSYGHASISFTISERAMKVMRLFDPARYGDLQFKNPIPKDERMPIETLHGLPLDEETEDGLQYDFYSQVAALIKAKREDSPFIGYDVKKLMLQGTTPGNLSAYVAAVHPVTKLPDGTPCFDGFLIFMTGAPGALNNSRNMLDPFDFRDLYYSEVPFIHLNTVADMLGDTMHPSWSVMWRRYQPNEEGRYLRLIEMAGGGIGIKFTAQYGNCKEDMEKAAATGALPGRPGGQSGQGGPGGKPVIDGTAGPGGRPVIDGTARAAGPANAPGPMFPQGEMYDFPAHLVLCAMIENLWKWMTTGEAPEKVNWLEMTGEYPDMTFARDKYGVFKGGLRNPYVDAPLFVTNSSGIITRRLTKEELTELYGTRAGYVQKVRESAERMVAHGHLLPEHVQFFIDEAEQADIPLD